MMQPSFHRRVIDQFAGLISEVNDKYAERWGAAAARGESARELSQAIFIRLLFPMLRRVRSFGLDSGNSRVERGGKVRAPILVG